MATVPPLDSPIKEVQLSALVVMRIIKHSTSTFPIPTTGCLVGMDVGAQLQVTNSFPYPATTGPNESQPNPADPYYHADQTAVSLAAPRAKQSVAYQNEMIKYLREVNVDAQSVGWYVSCGMGNFVTSAFVENQAFFQRAEGERTVALVFDVGRSGQGNLSMKAYRLSPAFMAAYKESKFTAENIQKSNLRYQDILQELPLTIHNSHLLTSFLHQLPTSPTENTTPDLPISMLDLQSNPKISSTALSPNPTTLDLSIDPYLESTTDHMLDAIEAHQTEQNNFQYHQRSLAREQAKITQWQQKRKSENVLRAQQKQPLLDENEWTKLFKLPAEPNRLEALLVGRQVEQYARMVDGFSAGTVGKLFGVRGGLVPGDNV
ncbi:hypothetical protein BAUCODRAFT_194835 [Baudoinia panamericana UAMH 10762]|uniref:Eukaryotic translation initiation factor 3 subunit H n=1 Tax=Baudoinia panamericana (strain UAMH 10762) TaxID=717646 RepID=M2NQ03_BAUPA|nr:uncharacterized protein BAUCODRAFT_194835 [Baudoinia panamericana UAMH 10762]EMD01076.1 hypothetical protein BAUCODRAFT_194835 [Baudoinia panamericana UAMH 10762]